MSRRTTSGGVGSPGGERAVVLGDTFLKLVHEALQLQYQEVMERQEREVARRFQEATERQEQEVERRFKKAMERQEQEGERRHQKAMKRQEQEMERKHQKAMKRQKQEAEHRHQKAMKRQELEAERRHQETMQRQQQEAERRQNDALCMQEQRAATALREAVAQMEVKLQEKYDAILAPEQRLEEIKYGEGSAKNLEGTVQKVEGRVQALEASLQRTLEKFFPRVDGLLRQMEKTTPRGAASSIPFSTTSPGNTCAVKATRGAAAGGREANPRASVSSASSASSSATASVLGASLPEGAAGDGRSGAGAGQGTRDVDERLQRQSVELRIQEAKERVVRTLATPSQMGKDLLAAAVQGRLAGVRRFLDSGADVNYVYSNGCTPLICALHSTRREGVVALLLQRGADVNAVNIYGRTAMQMAAWLDKSGRCLHQLVAAGGDVNARDVNGCTPLHWAAQKENEAAVRAILSAGARRDIKVWGGHYKNKTPFDLAKSQEIRDLLRFVT